MRNEDQVIVPDLVRLRMLGERLDDERRQRDRPAFGFRYG
jgi:hypothetical protein